MKSPLKNIGNPLYPGYSSAQDAYNEGFGPTGLNLDMSSQYDTGVLSDDRRPNVSIPGGIGTYNIAGAAGSVMNTQPIQATALAPAMTTPSDSGGGFGARFGANMASPQAMAGVASGLGGIFQGLIGRGRRRKAQEDAQDEYDKMMQQYKDLDTSNLYADVENKYMNMENVYEDLTVNQQQAQFEKQMFQQQQANIMQGLSGAAGGSGIAGLAQAMANQGQLAAQRASASIGLQESKIGMLRAGEASKLQQLERAGESQAEAMRLAGAERARGLDYRQTATQLGMSQQRLAASNRAIAQSDAALYGGIGSLVGTAASAAIGGVGG